MKYGYARVSTDDQTPALVRCLKKLKHGDTLIVWKLDRLGRSLADLIRVLDDFKKRGVKFRSLTEAIDTETPTSRAMWQMIGVPAELERSLISERTRAGVKAAKTRGVKFGRKPKLSRQQVDHIRKLIDDGQRREDVAELLTENRTTLYRAIAAGSQRN
jgi:DNA invertase Pin-like site-specific DNA recombinase